MFRKIGNCILSHCILSTFVLLLLIAMASFAYNFHEGKQYALNLQCKSNCGGLGFRILYYEYYHKHLPPAHVDAPDGNRMHSWRALMASEWMGLSHAEYPYDFNEPWNGPRNSKLLDQRIRDFACPSSSDSYRNKRLTNYFVVVGANTPFPGASTMSFIGNSETNDRSNTIFMVEAINMDIEWLEPRDLDYDAMSFLINDPKRPSISSHHPQGPHVSMADGSVRCLNKEIDPKVLQQMLSADKGVWRENEPDEDSDRKEPKPTPDTPSG